MMNTTLNPSLGIWIGMGLTAWGNDLAGIGEHLAGDTYEEYASANDFLID
jgi:hypothetical protein